MDAPLVEPAAVMRHRDDGIDVATIDSRVYGADQEAAIARMTTVSARIAADAAALDDPALEPEVALAAELLRLMEQAAPQGLGGNEP